MAAIKLDATPEGREVYLKLGFVDEYEVRRYIASPPGVTSDRSTVTVRPVDETDWPTIADLDRDAFGADRLSLLLRIASDNPHKALVAVARNQVPGFGLAYPGHDAFHLGPIVAPDRDTAAALLDTLLDLNTQPTVHFDLLSPNPEAITLASARNFTLQRRLTRMYLGRNDSPGAPTRIYAASGFETG